MNKNILIQKYLDKELSDSEMVDFNSLFNTDIEFREQVLSLEKIDTSLTKLRTEIRINDINFINKTYSVLTSTNSGPKYIGLVYKSRLIFSILALVLISITAIIWYNVSTNDSKNFKQEENANSENLIQQKNDILFNENQKTIVANDNINKVQKIAAVEELNEADNSELQKPKTKSVNTNELDISIKNNQQTRNQEIVNQLLADLENYKKDNEYLRAANTSKRVGLIYINVFKEYEKGLIFLNDAVQFSENTRNKTFLADMLTLAGKMEIAGGSKVKGIELIKKAIEIYETERSETAIKLKEFIKSY